MAITPETKCREGFDHNINMLPIKTNTTTAAAAAAAAPPIPRREKIKLNVPIFNITSNFDSQLASKIQY